MVNMKRLIEMAKKWQNVAALGRRRITSNIANSGASAETSSLLVVASRGHVFIYTIDGKRFMVPIAYLTSKIFRELLKMYKDEYGLPSDGPITLPCNAACMEFIVSSLRNQSFIDVERALLACFANNRCIAASSLLPQEHSQQHFILCSA